MDKPKTKLRKKTVSKNREMAGREDANTELIRLSKRLSELGLCSRREGDEFIKKGWVIVDGETVSELGYKITRSQEVKLNREAANQQDRQMTFLLNKPVGYVSGQPEPDKDYPPAVKLLTKENLFGDGKWSKDHFVGLAPAGRLDIDSRGLLVLTQDGRVAKALVGEDSPIEKEYNVYIKGEITPTSLEKLKYGLELDGKKLKRAKVVQLGPEKLRMTLTEGKKRQIRRMCELVGLTVTSLCRVRIGKIKLSDLPEGQYRYLGKNESF